MCWFRWKIGIVAFGLLLPAAGCTGILGPTEENADNPGAESDTESAADAGPKDVGSTGPDLGLAQNSAKPFERVPIEGLPEEVLLEDIHATIHPDESLEKLDGEFPGIVVPNEAGDALTLVAPFLADVEGGDVEVVLHLEDRDSDRLPLEIEATEVEEGAFSDAMDALAESTKEVIEHSEFTEEELRKQVEGESDVTEQSFGLAIAYHVMADSENPNRLTKVDVDEQTQQFLDLYATRMDLPGTLQEGASDLAAYQQPMSGHLGDGGGDAGEPMEVPAGDLSEMMVQYSEFDEVIEQVDAAGTALSWGAMVTTGILTAGGAPAYVSAVGAVASKLGMSLSIIEFLTSALNASYPCCITKMEHELEGSPTVKEDQATPQVNVTSVEVLAESDGTQVALEFFSLAADILFEKISDTKFVEDAQSTARGKFSKVVSEGLSDAINFDKVLAKLAVSDFLVNEVKTLVNRVVEAAVGDAAVVDVRRWESQLHGGGENGGKWLVPLVKGSGGRSILEDVSGTDDSFIWRLTKEAYDYRSSTIVLTQDTSRNKFPTGDYGKAQAVTQQIRMNEIEVDILPRVANAEGGGKVEFTTRVEHAEDTSIQEIAAGAGTVTQQVDPNAEDVAEQQFVWKAPEKKEKFPVKLRTRSTSDEGLRGELMGSSPDHLPPDHEAITTVYNGDHLSIPGVSCVETGGSRTLEARVAPRDEELAWQSAGPGSLNVGEDTHTAVYQAPGSETKDKITVTHADDEGVKDSTTVYVREDCLCTMHVWVAGHVDNFVDDTGRTLKATADEKEGSFAVSYLGDDVASTVGAPGGLTDSELSEGTVEFVGPFEYNVGVPVPDVVIGQERASVEVEWRDEFRPVVRSSGIARVCYRNNDEECNPEEDPSDTARYEATYFPAAQRRIDDGTLEAMTCDGDTRTLEDGDGGGTGGGDSGGDSGGSDDGGSDGSSDAGSGSGGGGDGGGSGGSTSCPDPKEPSFDCPDTTTCCEHDSSDSSCEYRSPCHIPDEINGSDDWTCTPGTSC